VLSNDTRKIIDDARNTLVGQIPVPMMQCQQITLALTYKFMSDDDLMAVELGGERHYFAGELERYSWERLVSLTLDDTQRSELYRAGLGALQESETMPAVFREIFKDAVVPYGDHRTLALFLNTMDRMVYDDSEKLGDAYEYLLKTAEAQADAGQFRTPRHIIDFIVKIVNPQKHEVIIDPACGTAGFLVSAYQHVKSQHELPGGGSSLSVPDLTRLADNLKGYDISPEMTKLAMANMYLHTQNKDPNIDNYDTLTSTDHWNEYADVMLANPPFMTPRGGIKPHTRFRVPATRSEVLFVDYIASHLNEYGRAGIIVPEGIIFQSQNAYRQLRRFLLDESLVAVISLPGGVFNPYSGVKTSILILDKVLAPRTDGVAFFKVENDGYDLGAQRRSIDKDDLPAVFDEITEYLRRLRNGESVDEYRSPRGRVVAKSRIADDGEYNLTGERYSVAEVPESRWTTVKVGRLFQRSADTVMPSDMEGPVTYVGLENISQDTGYLIGDTVTEDPATIKSLKNEFGAGEILYGKLRPNLNKVWLSDRSGICSTDIYVVRPKQDDVVPELYAYIFRSRRFNDAVVTQVKGAQLPRVGWDAIAALEVPWPPLEIQRELVAEIEGHQRVMDGARAVVDNWRPRFAVDPEWPLVELKCIATVASGFGFPTAYQGNTDEEIPFLKVSDMNLPGNESKIVTWNNSVSRSTLQDLKAKSLPSGTVIFPKIGAAISTNKKRLLTCESAYDNNVLGIAPDGNRIVPEFLYAYMMSFDLSSWASDSNPPSMRKTTVENHKIPLPSLENQNAIVAEIEAEQALVSANRELVKRMEQRIQDAIARVWTAQPDQAAQS